MVFTVVCFIFTDDCDNTCGLCHCYFRNGFYREIYLISDLSDVYNWNDDLIERRSSVMYFLNIFYHLNTHVFDIVVTKGFCNILEFFLSRKQKKLTWWIDKEHEELYLLLLKNARTKRTMLKQIIKIILKDSNDTGTRSIMFLVCKRL